MKKSLLLIATLFSASLFAQERTETTLFENDVNVSVGLASLTTIVGGLSMALEGMSSEWDKDQYVSGQSSTLPAINISYGRQLTPLLNVGVALSYAQVTQDINDTTTEQKAGYNMFGAVVAIPTLRCDWLRRTKIRCYSKLGVGVGSYINREVIYDDATLSEKESSLGLGLDFVPFGFAVGSRFYGFGEIGLGSIGILKLGGGYRF